MLKEESGIKGQLTIELHDGDGNLIHREIVQNLVTAVGDQYYAGRAVLAAGLPDQITGMKLGSGATTPAKSGAGAALATYLDDSHQALTATPTVSNGSATFIAHWAAGKATTASPITEVVLVNEALTNATSAAANTVARALISGVPSKSPTDELTVTWTHTLLGA